MHVSMYMWQKGKSWASHWCHVRAYHGITHAPAAQATGRELVEQLLS